MKEVATSKKQHILFLSVVLVSGLISGLCIVRAQEARLTGRDIMVKADEQSDGEDYVGWFVLYDLFFEPFLSRLSPLGDISYLAPFSLTD